MAIDLRIQNPKTVEELAQNNKEIADVAIHKQTVDIDTTSISTVFTDADTEAVRLILLELITNFKNS